MKNAIASAITRGTEPMDKLRELCAKWRVLLASEEA
jgi:hypothetical protein